MRKSSLHAHELRRSTVVATDARGGLPGCPTGCEIQPKRVRQAPHALPQLPLSVTNSLSPKAGNDLGFYLAMRGESSSDPGL